MTRKAKSKIHRMPPEVRAAIDSLLREDRHTLAEMIAELQRRFPDVEAPSMSGLHRYAENFEAMLGQMRSFDRAAQAIVGELGDTVGEKASGLLVHAITTVATGAAMRAQGDEDLSIDEARKLAQMAKNAMEARRLSFNERKAIRQEAREELQREQAARLDTVVKEAGLSDETAATFRRKVLGLK